MLFSLFTAGGLLSAGAEANKKPALSGTETIIINEVAWAGTSSTTTADEWIELYNPGPNPVDISSWVLRSSTDTSPNITFPNGTIISSGGYFLLERTDDTTVPSEIADLIYTGELSNNNESLELRDKNNFLIDTANRNAGAWPAGVAGPDYCSMERIGPVIDADGNWVNSPTNIPPICGSPKAQNSQFITPTPSLTPSSTPEWERRILINEVAWGGTTADGSIGQWIELYNPGDALNVTGWSLAAGDGFPIIVLSGNIPQNGYFILARRNDVFSSVPVNQVFSDPLDATGETLRLFNISSILVDSANLNGGAWPAGSGFPVYVSMERNAVAQENDSSWINFADTPFVLDRTGNPVFGSPGYPNWALGKTQTPSPTPTNTSTSTPTPTHTLTLTPTQTTTPSSAKSIIINEVAWAGTIASDTDEWIELYNPGTASINITGWTLSSGSSFSITLAGAIPAGGYFLLERTDNDTVKDIAADQIFSGSLTNTGMALQLKATSGSVIDTANNSGGAWPAGNATTRCSMERRPGTNYPDTSIYWITNSGVLKNGKDASDNDICGTPRNINWANYVTPTPTSVGPTRTPTKTRTPTPIPAAKISQVIINEFMPHPRSDWNNDGQVDSGDEFIELMNVGNASINLQGWRLDDQNGDSSPYTLGSVDLAPGARLVFFASQTGLLLSNRSDSVRVLKANGSISDAYTYTTVPVPDQSWCRLPDGKPTWVFGCQPTLAQTNQLAETVYRAEVDLPAVCESPNLPTSIYLAECLPSGLDAWSRRLWDGFLPVFQVLYERHGQQYWIE